MNFNEF